MRPKRSTHVLFIIDDLDAKKSGVYALARWCIRLLNRLKTYGHAIKITCTSVKRPKSVQVDNDFIQENGIEILYPSRYGYKSRSNVYELSLEDLINHDKQYYRKLEQVNNVTHILIFSPLTEEVSLPDGLISRVKKEVSLQNGSENDVKVVLFNQWSQQSRKSLATILQNISGVVSVGPKLHTQWTQHLKDTTNIKHVGLYPTFDELPRVKNPSKQPAAHFVILTLHSKFLYRKCVGTTFSERLQASEFLKTLSRCISETARKVKATNQPGTALTWCIHCPGLDNNNKYRLLDELTPDNPALEIEIETKSLPIEDLVSKCSVCLQPGLLDCNGFSGLETFLCGAPTLVLSNSDVGLIFKDIDDMFGEYFTLDNETYTDYEKNAPIWEKKILKLLTEKERTFQRTVELLFKYLYHSKQNGTISTEGGIRSLFTDVLDLRVPEEDLNNAMKPRWLKERTSKSSAPVIPYNEPRRRKQKQTHKRTDKRKEKQKNRDRLMSADQSQTIRSDSSGGDENETELKTPDISKHLTDVVVEELATDDAKAQRKERQNSESDSEDESTDDSADYGATGGVKPKNPKRIFIPEIEFGGTISSDENEDITFAKPDPTKITPKFLRDEFK